MIKGVVNDFSNPMLSSAATSLPDVPPDACRCLPVVMTMAGVTMRMVVKMMAVMLMPVMMMLVMMTTPLSDPTHTDACALTPLLFN